MIESISKRSFISTRETTIVDYLRQLDPSTFYCIVNGRIEPDFLASEACNGGNEMLFLVHFRLVGGKGGFGSLLRSFRVNKSTNQLMCRDLNGRRLASIDEEKRLRKWIEKAAEREKLKHDKQKARYEKLKAGDPKHQFNDPDYMRQKEDILERTEEAFEAGFEHFKKKQEEKKKAQKPEESDSDIDFEDIGTRGGVKRKSKNPSESSSSVAAKKAREEELTQAQANRKDSSGSESDEEEDSDSEENDADPELLQEIQNYFKNKAAGDEDEDSPSTSGSSTTSLRKKETEATNKTQNTGTVEQKANEEELTTKEKQKQPYVKRDVIAIDFAAVDLEGYSNAEELEALGLDHLKNALEARGLKCGGSLQERASRLFSVKGLDPKDYPKKIVVAQMKKTSK